MTDLSEKRVASFEKEILQKYYAEVESMYTKMRSDYRHHIQTMKVHKVKGEYEEIAKYLDTWTICHFCIPSICISMPCPYMHFPFYHIWMIFSAFSDEIAALAFGQCRLSNSLKHQKGRLFM